MKRLSTTVLAALTAMAVLVPAQAQADSYVRADAVQDVLSSRDDGPLVRTPSRAEGDIRTSGVSHAGRRVTIALAFRQLTQTTEATGHIFRIRTNKGRVRDVTVLAVPGHWAGLTEMTKPSGKRVKCRIATTMDYAGDRMSVSVPRKCLGSPRWVRVGIGEVTIDDEITFVDDAMTNARVGENPVWGPVVRRS